MSEENLEESVVIGDVEPEVEVEIDPFEERARRMGWRPLEEYNGDKARWVDAKTFVERGENELPILRERNRALDRRLANTERTVEETSNRLKETTQVLTEVREMARAAEERGYATARRELAERERKAVAEAQVEEYDRIQRERAALDAERPKITSTPPKEPEARPPVTTNPAIDAWIADNPWFNSDPVLNSVAIAFDASLQRDAPHLGMSERLDEVKKQVMTRFPEKFNNPRRAAPPAVSTTNLAAPKNNKKGIKDLPKEAQDAFARFKRQMPAYTEEEYLKVYGEM